MAEVIKIELRSDYTRCSTCGALLPFNLVITAWVTPMPRCPRCHPPETSYRQYVK
jgi:hypothetical protein